MIEYENSYDDLLAFTRFHMVTSPAGKRTRLLVGSMAAVVVLAFGISFSLAAQVPWMIPLFALLSLGAAAGSRRALLRSVGKSAERLYRDGKNVGMTGWHRLTITERELHEESAGGSQVTKPEAIEKVMETEDHVYIYVSAVSAHVIPRDRVSAGDLPSFLTALKGLAPDVTV